MVQQKVLDAREKGLCTRCYKRPATEGMAYCKDCRGHDKIRYRQKKVRGNMPYGKSNIPEGIVQRVIEDLREYQARNKFSYSQLGRVLGCSGATVQTWLKGSYSPRKKAIIAMGEAGITQVKLPDVVQKKAVEKVLGEIDNKNKVPRKYTRHVSMPDMVRNQVKLLIDEYVESLDTPRTFSEFSVTRNDFIDKLYFTCTQGQ